MALTFWQDVLAVFYPVSNHEERLLLRHFGNVDPFQSEDVISWQQALGCIVPAVTRFQSCYGHSSWQALGVCYVCC